jgi:hypothetical protein
MQKVQSYLYPNRVILIADLAGFTVENTIVYAKTVKIYKGVDNVIQFDIQNADQKRLDLVTTPLISNIALNVMDASGNKLPNSPYTVTPIGTTLPGIATVKIPSADLVNFNDQYLKYSVTATDTNSNNIPLYTDSRFGAVGTIEIVESATPTTRSSVVYDRFSGEINFMGNVTDHTSAIPCKFYEAVPTTALNFAVALKNFIGTIYVEATEDSTISVESFKNAAKIQSFTTSVATTTTHNFSSVPVGKYNYMRISWTYPDVWQYSGQQDPTIPFGMVNSVTVSY